MKKTILTSITLSLVLILSFSVNVFADDEKLNESNVQYSVDFDDEILSDSILLSETSEIKDGRIITKSVYQLSDGTKITDTLEHSAYSTRSSNGSDTVTRTRDLDDWGSITLTASFKWWKKEYFSYVKCTSVSASHNLDSQVVVSVFDKGKTSGKVTLGSAKAWVEYSMYNSKVPLQFRKGTFKIYCSDTGSISDNE